MRDLALGTARLQSSPDPFRLLDIYAEHGGRLIDTAVVYQSALRLLATRLARPAFRDVTVAVKVCHPPLCSPAHIRQQVELARSALGLDTVPLLVLHRDNPDHAVDDWAEGVAEHVEAGSVAAVGLSNWTPARAAAIRSLLPISWVDGQYSLLVPRRPVWEGTRSFQPTELTELVATTPQVAAWSPLSGIASLRRDPKDPTWSTPENLTLLSGCERLAIAHSCEPAEIALAWLRWAQPAVIPVVGPTKVSHLHRLQHVSIPTADLADLHRPPCASD